MLLLIEEPYNPLEAQGLIQQGGSFKSTIV